MKRSAMYSAYFVVSLRPFFSLVSYLVLLILLSCWGSVSEGLKCIHRDYGNGGTVCVCNETYCDTVEPVGPLGHNEYYLYISTKSGMRLESVKKEFENRYNRDGVQMMVNPKVRYQKVLGFGGAFTDAAGMNIKSLGPGAQENLLSSYFSPKGIEYSLGRVPIGGTDFSTRKYSLDNNPEDSTLEDFSLTKEDLDFKIPIILASQRLSSKKIDLIGSAWSPPPWMKSNNDYVCFGVLKSEYYDLWAKYHIRFLEEYKKRGLSFWALTTGNEPTAGLLPYYSFNCLGWTPFSQSKWISQNLGPRLKNSKFNETLIIGLDDQRFLAYWWPKLMFHNELTKSYMDGFGLHWYWDKYVPSQVLDLTHFAFPNKFILYTESCYVKERGQPAVVLGSWKRGEGYAASIINTMNHYVGGWVDWNIALDPKGGPNWVNNVVDSPIIVNATAGEFYKQPMFYALGHFSKFVPKGSVRISLKQTKTSDIDSIGFLAPENRIVLVILNKSKRSVRINVYGTPKGVASFLMPKKSIITVFYKNTN